MSKEYFGTYEDRVSLIEPGTVWVQRRERPDRASDNVTITKCEVVDDVTVVFFKKKGRGRNNRLHSFLNVYKREGEKPRIPWEIRKKYKTAVKSLADDTDKLMTGDVLERIAAFQQRTAIAAERIAASQERMEKIWTT